MCRSPLFSPEFDRTSPLASMGQQAPAPAQVWKSGRAFSLCSGEQVRGVCVCGCSVAQYDKCGMLRRKARACGGRSWRTKKRKFHKQPKRSLAVTHMNAGNLQHLKEKIQIFAKCEANDEQNWWLLHDSNFCLAASVFCLCGDRFLLRWLQESTCLCLCRSVLILDLKIISFLQWVEMRV